jgi:hypothetical protein
MGGGGSKANEVEIKAGAVPYKPSASNTPQVSARQPGIPMQPQAQVQPIQAQAMPPGMILSPT